MYIKWIGAMLIIAGCGGWGFSLAAAYRYQEKTLRQLNRVLQLMQWELKYRLTPLPELCRMAAKDASGEMRKLFLDLARELDWNGAPEASGCMSSVLKRHAQIPPKTRKLLRLLGKTLGRFDLEGQIQGMESVRRECVDAIQGLDKDREVRIRSYHTLGLCAGAALVILFL